MDAVAGEHDHAGTDQPRRAPPPASALRWAADAAGGGRIQGVRRLRGATSSVLHELIVERAGTRRAVVLRRYLHPAWVASGPALVDQEQAALRAARSSPWPAPELLAVDRTGDAAGAPALLMTRLAGRPRVTPRDGWLEQLAAVHRAMAAWQQPAAPLPAYTSWIAARPEPPAWSTRPDAWTQAIELATGRLPEHRPFQPIHRDLHPGNVTFEKGLATGVVDWVNACEGPIESDLAQCRINLVVLAGLDAADRFLAATGELGRQFDPAWDLVVAVGLLPDPTSLTALNQLGAAVTAAGARRSLDQLVARTVATRR